jgi:hypothetical protein
MDRRFRSNIYVILRLSGKVRQNHCFYGLHSLIMSISNNLDGNFWKLSVKVKVRIKSEHVIKEITYLVKKINTDGAEHQLSVNLTIIYSLEWRALF